MKMGQIKRRLRKELEGIGEGEIERRVGELDKKEFEGGVRHWVTEGE